MRAYEKSVIFFLAFIATTAWFIHLDLNRIETSLKSGPGRPVIFITPPRGEPPPNIDPHFGGVIDTGSHPVKPAPSDPGALEADRREGRQK